jgi:hypothetical protein
VPIERPFIGFGILTSNKVGREFKGESRGFRVLKIEKFKNLNLDSF